MTAPILSWDVDANGLLTYVSPSALEFFNKTTSETMGAKVETLTGASFNPSQMSPIGLLNVISNGQRIHVQCLPFYEGTKMVGARMIGSSEKIGVASHWSNRILNVPFAVLAGALSVSILLCVVSMFLHSAIFSGVSLAASLLVGSVAAQWNYIRSSVLKNLCAPKNRLCLQDLSGLPLSLRHNHLIKKSHQTHLLNMISVIRLREDLAFQKTFANILEDNCSPWVAADHNLTILRCNQSFAQMVGSNSTCLEGQSISAFIPFTTVPFTAIAFETVHNDRRYEITVDPKIFGENVSYIAFSFKDVTELRGDEQSLLQLVCSPNIEVDIHTNSAFVDAMKYSLEKVHSENRNFIAQVFHHLKIEHEHKSLDGMKQELLHVAHKMGEQMNEVMHLAQLLQSQKLLLKDFIPHQSNLLDNLISEVSNSNINSSALKLKNLDIQKYGQKLATILQSVVVSTQDQYHKIQGIHNTVSENKHRLDYLYGEQETSALCIDMKLEDRLVQQNTSMALLEVTESINIIQNNFMAWDNEAQEFLRTIAEASKSSFDLLSIIADTTHHIENLVENVESAYEVVDIMCQDQIVHSCIGEYINQGVDDLETTLFR